MNPINPIAELTAAINLGRQLAAQARAELIAATPALVAAIRHQSGQSDKLEQILWSTWGGALCEALAGLDANLAQAAVAVIAARAHCGGDADDLLRAIIDGSGSQPPTVPAP